MAVLAFLGASDATLGKVLATAWLVVLSVGLYQYTHGTRSRERFYLTLAMGTLWLAFSLLQIATAFSQMIHIGAVVLAVAVFCGGIVIWFRWWRIRNSGTDATGQV